ncbi:MAG TPA: cyclic peptide export ABC transporter [Thermoanaerobaculia bacterium]|jgi:putative ATP-binding cassette transporter|nr:cyclic peptide export ABC transporter [Thermoanaerobaculia bacterium]
MKFFQLIREGARISLRDLMAIGAIAGLSNALVLAIINKVVELGGGVGSQGIWYLLLFLVTIGIYNIAQRHVMAEATTEIENLLHRLRVRLADKIRHCDLQPLEGIGRSQIYASVNKETQSISQASGLIVVGYQAAILLFFMLFYLAWLSTTALLMYVGFTGAAIFLYLQRMGNFNSELHASMVRENTLFDSFTDLLDGFKEVKMNPKRSEAVFKHLADASAHATEMRVKTQTWIAHQFIFSQMTFYLLVAVMVFLLPRLLDSYGAVVVKTTTTVLFLIGPVTNLVSSIPVFATANAAAENIDALEALLDQSAYVPPAREAEMPSFQAIRFQGVTFQYQDPRTASWFTVGPVDLELRRGETVFITGGNGSGKSTFLKLLTALYYPKQGVIRVDNVALAASNYEAYRKLFTAIFSDYHLFSRLYGLAVEPDQVAALLQTLELEGKVRYGDDRFDTLELSTGQKKRLALLVSLLEDAPIYVFDEWAAEQDPHFRRRFYEEILPDLKRRGKLVVAVTHDDRYFHVAERVLKMEEGRFVDL